jgi:hypothetical protein
MVCAMTDNAGAVSTRSFTGRVVVPAGISLGIWLVLNFLSTHLGWIESAGAYRLSMNAVHLLLFFYLIFGGMFAYRVMYFRGATLLERLAASYAVPAAFIIKEVIRVGDFFPFGEALYYGLSPYPFLSLLIGQAALLAIGELTCRFTIRKRTGGSERIITMAPVVTIMISLACVYFLLLWNLGEDAYWIQIELYKLLFK